MKKRPQKKYKPGELAKTRSNLGELSEEEAKKMTRLLGGEIGIEQDPEDIEKKYKKLLAAEQRKKRLEEIERARSKHRGRKLERDGRGDQALEAGNALPPGSREKLGYLDRIRIDYLSSKPEYGLKTIPGVIASFFSFLTDVPDRLNPRFLKNANDLFFLTLSSFVNSIRWLYTKAKKDIYKEISKNAFYANVLSTIKSWDIEGISIELSMLQKNPGRTLTSSCAGLVKKLYKPFGVLLYLDYEVQVKRAIAWAYEMHLAGTPAEDRLSWKNIIFYYERALELLPQVFTNIKKMLYPLLLKLASSRFLFFEEYFAWERKSIMRYLSLAPENILNPQDEKHHRFDAGKKHDGGSDVDDMNEGFEGGEAQTAAFEAGADTAKDYREGLALLDSIFPQAGFTNLDSLPDLYPYFQPLFGFPQGFELVPPADPLQAVVVMNAVIGNIFYCFRHIRFGSVRDSKLEPKNIKEEMERLVASWQAFGEEMIMKTYIPRLADLCRNIEKDASFLRSELGEKAVNELIAIKTAYILPYMKLKTIVRPLTLPRKNFPRFYETVASMRGLLQAISSDLRVIPQGLRDSGGLDESLAQGRESVENPLDRFAFDVENPVSRRLFKIASKQKKRQQGQRRSIDGQTNADVIDTCFALVSSLDYLLNSEKSFFYSRETWGLYRASPGSAGMPERSVKLKDTQMLLDALEKDSEIEIREIAGETGAGRETHGVIIRYEKDLASETARAIDELAMNPDPFSVIFYCVRGEAEPDRDSIRRILDLALDEAGTKDIIFKLTDTEYILLLRSTDIGRAKQRGTRLVSSLMAIPGVKDGGFTASCGAVQYRNDWKQDALLSVIEKIKSITRKQAAPRLVFLDNDNLTLKALPVQ